MIRRTLSTVSVAAVLALGAAAPALACNQQPSSAATPQAQPEHAKFADKGFFRHHHGHHHMRFIQKQQAQQQTSSSRSSRATAITAASRISRAAVSAGQRQQRGAGRR